MDHALPAARPSSRGCDPVSEGDNVYSVPACHCDLIAVFAGGEGESPHVRQVRFGELWGGAPCVAHHNGLLVLLHGGGRRIRECEAASAGPGISDVMSR